MVEGINIVKKHTKQSATSKGGIESIEMPIHLCKLAIQDPKTLDFYEMPKEKGTLLVFCPLLFHRVTPVENGVRYCIQEFMLGDTFV